MKHLKVILVVFWATTPFLAMTQFPSVPQEVKDELEIKGYGLILPKAFNIETIYNRYLTL